MACGAKNYEGNDNQHGLGFEFLDGNTCLHGLECELLEENNGLYSFGVNSSRKMIVSMVWGASLQRKQ